MKPCTKCGVEKERGEFNQCNRNGDGLQYWCRACHRQWKQANGRLYRQANKDKIRRDYLIYIQTPSGKASRLRSRHRRTALIKRLPNTLTTDEWESILASYDYACAYCGAAWHELDRVLEQDHVIPLFQDGGYTVENVVPACRSCNALKGPRTPDQAGMKLRQVRA